MEYIVFQHGKNERKGLIFNPKDTEKRKNKKSLVVFCFFWTKTIYICIKCLRIVTISLIEELLEEFLISQQLESKTYL